MEPEEGGASLLSLADEDEDGVDLGLLFTLAGEWFGFGKERLMVFKFCIWKTLKTTRIPTINNTSLEALVFHAFFFIKRFGLSILLWPDS